MSRPRPLLLLFLLLAPAVAFSAEAPVSFADALARGRLSLHLRLRHEAARQEGLRPAEALTARARLGFAPAPWACWSALLEGETVAAADGDRYSQAGLNPAAAGRAVIADPDSSELNQLWLGRTLGGAQFRLGRQPVVLDNGRFVGDGQWRQNQQTFDAARLEHRGLPGTTLTYIHVRQVNRGLGRAHPQGRWRSHAHLFHAARAGLPAGTVTAYTYLLDLPSAPASSCATSGAHLAGETAGPAGGRWTYRAEVARQTDHGSSPLRYAARYLAVEAGFPVRAAGLAAGLEILGQDRGVPVRTPVATLHPFNGWAGAFGTPPAGGLRDRFVRASFTLPGGLNGSVRHHDFQRVQDGARLGDEWDAMLSRRFGDAWAAQAKAADFRSAGRGIPSLRRVWLQVEYFR